MKIFFILLAFIPSLVWAQQSVTFLLRNNAKVSFAFGERPVVTTDADGLTVAVNGKVRLSLPYSDVRSVCFNDGLPTNVSPSLRGARTDVSFSISDRTLTVRGLSPGESVSLHDASGILLSRAAADSDGTLSMPVKGLTKGTYIINTQAGISYKFFNK